MILMNLTFRTISPNFLWNIHVNRYQLSNRETHGLLYFFCMTLETPGLPIAPSESRAYGESVRKPGHNQQTDPKCCIEDPTRLQLPLPNHA
jgi:hypothetical protein